MNESTSTPPAWSRTFPHQNAADSVEEDDVTPAVVSLPFITTSVAGTTK